MDIAQIKLWNTWNAASPAIMEHIGEGFRIIPSLMSENAADYSSLPFGDQIRLIEHEKNCRYARLFCTYNGTKLQIEYAKPDAETVICRIRTIKNGEWGLRFWVNISFGFAENGRMEGFSGANGSCFFAAAFADEPIRAASTNEPYDESAKMARMGYYAPEICEPDGRWSTAKFNLELTPEIVFAASRAGTAMQAKAAAEAAVHMDIDALKEAALGAEEQAEGYMAAEAAAAVRDVMAWNTLYDRVNSRAFTSITRFWIERKFGGWFVWLDDLFYHGLIAAVSGDADMGRRNIEAALGNACPAGNFACLMSEYTKWVDRSQPPICAFIIYKYYLYTGDKALLGKALPLLKRSLAWWRVNRRAENGLFCYGSGELGEGHFKNTKLAAKDESSMDNSPMHDTAVYDKATHMLDMNDIALNSLLVTEAEHTALIARALGGDEPELSAFAARLGARIDEAMFDERRGLYANRKLSGEFVSVSPTSFYPLLAGFVGKEREERLVANMFDEEQFFTPWPFPSVSAQDPAAHDDVYWRGRGWAPLNFLTFAGLMRARRDDEAYLLAKRGMEGFLPGWREASRCYENFDAFGQNSENRDADPYYGWGALIPLMWIAVHIDADAWNGLCIMASAKEPFAIRKHHIGGRIYSYSADKDGCALECDGRALFAISGARGRARNIVCDGAAVSFVLDAQNGTARIDLPKAAKSIIIDEREAPAADGGTELPKGKELAIKIVF